MLHIVRVAIARKQIRGKLIYLAARWSSEPAERYAFVPVPSATYGADTRRNTLRRGYYGGAQYLSFVAVDDHPYVAANTVSVSHLRKDSLSLNCLNSSVSSLSTAVITRPSALSCSIRAFCLSEFFLAF